MLWHEQVLYLFLWLNNIPYSHNMITCLGNCIKSCLVPLLWVLSSPFILPTVSRGICRHKLWLTMIMIIYCSKSNISYCRRKLKLLAWHAILMGWLTCQDLSHLILLGLFHSLGGLALFFCIGCHLSELKYKLFFQKHPSSPTQPRIPPQHFLLCVITSLAGP